MNLQKLDFEDAEANIGHTGWGYVEWRHSGEDYPDVSWRETYPQRDDAYFTMNTSGEMIRATFYSLFSWGTAWDSVTVDMDNMNQDEPHRYNTTWDIENDHYNHPSEDEGAIVLRNNKNEVTVIDECVAKQIWRIVKVRERNDEQLRNMAKT